MVTKEQLKEAQSLSELELDAIRSETPTYENVHTHLKRFILLRFLITDGFFDDSLAALAEHSVQLTLAAAKKDYDEQDESLRDLSMNCAGASSAETKRALLLITLRKQLDLDIPPSMAATHDTVSALSEEITRQLVAKQLIR